MAERMIEEPKDTYNDKQTSLDNISRLAIKAYSKGEDHVMCIMALERAVRKHMEVFSR